MAKDPRNIKADDSSVKRGLKKIQERSDENIAAQAKDMSSEQIQAGNEARLSGMPSGGSAVKDAPAIPDPLTPKPTIEEITPGEEARRAATNVGTGRPARTTVLDFGKLPKRPPGASKPGAVNINQEDQDVFGNNLDRYLSGRGVAGEENGILEHAVKLHERDRQIAIRTGKRVTEVSPNDPPTDILSVAGGHHHRLAKVMHAFGISDEEVYRNAAHASGKSFESHIYGLHDIAQQHLDSKRHEPQRVEKTDMWEHPSTKEVIPVSANHPDMPSAFMRTKQKIVKVTRNSNGEEVYNQGHEGWDAVKVRGGKRVFRYNSAPTEGMDLVDHLRAQMLSEHGPSTTSRKRGADIATQIADVATGRVPKGMKAIGRRKVGRRAAPLITEKPKDGGSVSYGYTPQTVEGSEPLLVPKAPAGTRADKKPKPPKAKKGVVLVGQATPEQRARPRRATPAQIMQDSLATGRRSFQPYLPGTGQPKYEVSEVTPAKYEVTQGPLTQHQAKVLEPDKVPLPDIPKLIVNGKEEESAAGQMMRTGTPPGYNPESYRQEREKIYTDAHESLKKYAVNTKKPGEKNINLNEAIRTVQTAPAVTETNLVSTDRDWKPQNPNRGQQFSGIDTTGMTGAEETRALSAARAFVHQQPSASREVVVRPGGNKQARRDRVAAKKAAKQPKVEQLSLFPDTPAVTGRTDEFMMGGVIKPISESSKKLQADASKAMGSREVEPVSGSRADKKAKDEAAKKLA